MSKDMTEYIDDYCRDNYGHSNWGYEDTFSPEEIKDFTEKDMIAERNDGIIFFKEDVDDDE